MTGTAQADSRAAAVVRQLREAIFEGRYSPGMPLRELTLARELQVSQSTIREALQQLEHAGLVTRQRNVGSFVTRLSPKDIRERVQLRVLLEVLAARCAAGRMTPTDFTELNRRLAVLAEAIAADRYYETSQADLDFHRYIWQCSGNDTLCTLLEQVTVPLFAFVSILRSHGLQKLHSVVASHTPLIKALRSRDAGRIAAAFRRGATASYERFLDDANPLESATVFGFLDPD